MRQASFKRYFLVGGLLAALFLSACKPPAPLPSPAAVASPTPQTESNPTRALEPSPAVITPAPSATAAPLPSQTPEAQPCEEAGQIGSTSLSSTALDREIPINIYFPPCYTAKSASPYPVLYLLHGFDSDQEQWVALGLREAADALLKAGKTADFMIIMPYMAQPNLSALERNQSFFMTELLPFIEENYPVQTQRSGRAIGGISRGASWALRLGLMPDLPFGRIGAHSLPPLSGEVEAWLASLAGMEPLQRPLLFLDIGNNDKDLEAARAFDLELTKQAIPHTWYMFAGRHDSQYWQAHLPIYLEWYAQGWPLPATDK